MTTEMTPTDVAALAEQVPDGGLLVLPPDYSFVPMELIRALIRRGVKDLHAIAVPVSGMAACPALADGGMACGCKTGGNG